MIKGRPHYVVHIAEPVASNLFKFGIDKETGRVSEQGFWYDTFTGILHKRGKISVNPPTARFEKVKKISVNKSKPFVNYELIYTGRTKDSISMIYREYTPDNMARLAFFQNLKYELKGKDTEIAFKQIKIVVKEATNNSIKYTVITD